MRKIISITGSLLICASAMAFTGDNDPKFILDKNYVTKFSSLPMSGELLGHQTPWSSSFWPHIYGGIAFRWNGYYQDAPVIRNLQHEIGDLKKEIIDLKHELFTIDNPSKEKVIDIESKMQAAKSKISSLLMTKGAEHKKYFFDIKRPTSLTEVKAMTQDERDKLSATEKYDIYVALKTGSELSSKLTNNILNYTGPYSAYWEGICNGWSSAAIEFDEPEVKSYSKNGITINFGSSDFKGLLSYYHAAITLNPMLKKKNLTGRVGERCKTEFPKEAWFIKDGKEYYKVVENGVVVTKLVPADCVDTDAGAFHLVVTNQIAIKKQGFVAEVVRDNEIWNQPVFGYTSKVLSSTNSPDAYATENTAKQVRVATTMSYANDGGRMFWEQEDPEEEFYAWWNPTNGTTNYRGGSKDFEYILDLDKRGNIIGGRWLSYERPDFLWLKKSKGFITSGMMLGIVGYMNHLRDFVIIR